MEHDLHSVDGFYTTTTRSTGTSAMDYGAGVLITPTTGTGYTDWRGLPLVAPTPPPSGSIYWPPSSTAPGPSPVSVTITKLIRQGMLAGIRAGKSDIELAKEYAVYFKLLRDTLKEEIGHDF